MTDGDGTVHAGNGAPGEQGEQGEPCDPGPAGPAFIGSAFTLPSGSPGTVRMSLDETGGIVLQCAPDCSLRLTVGQGRMVKVYTAPIEYGICNALSTQTTCEYALSHGVVLLGASGPVEWSGDIAFFDEDQASVYVDGPKEGIAMPVEPLP